MIYIDNIITNTYHSQSSKFHGYKMLTPAVSTPSLLLESWGAKHVGTVNMETRELISAAVSIEFLQTSG